jgi:hypothetical protein
VLGKCSTLMPHPQPETEMFFSMFILFNVGIAFCHMYIESFTHLSTFELFSLLMATNEAAMNEEIGFYRNFFVNMQDFYRIFVCIYRMCVCVCVCVCVCEYTFSVL